MAVIITNMDMPRSCDSCKFSNYHDGDDYCELFKILNGCSWRAKDVKWNENCPLKSTDEMIAELETKVFTDAYDGQFVGIEDVKRVINKYCKETNG